MRKINIENLFTVFALLFGLTFSILFPLYQTPDELSHIDMIYEERNLDIHFLDINDNFTGSDNLIQETSNKVKLKDYFDFNKRIKIKSNFVVPKITIIRHFPQFIGMLIGEYFSLPVILYVTLCEFMALFFYIIICRKAIKIIPAKKETFMFVMLLPVCCQQMSSFSYDVVLNSFCFLYIAYIFYLKEKQKIYIHDLIVSFLIIIIIGICKIPYVLLFLLNLMLFDFTILGNLSKKKKVVLFIEFILIIILALMISKKTLLCFNIGRLLISSIKNFHLTLKLIYRTLCSFFVGYLKSIVGPLGWFDVNVSNFLIFFVYFIMLILSCFINNNKKLCLSKKDKIICIATIILLCYFIILSMFNWTLFLDDVANYNNLSMNEYNFYIKNLDVIRGVQGRYFIPVIALLVCLFNNLKISLKSSYFLLLFYYIFIYLYYVYVLLNRYWIS